MSAIPIDITGQWAKLNDTIIALVDYIPDDKLDWSPRDDLWNFRGIMLHTIISRDNWLQSVVRDGETATNVLQTGQTKEGMKQELRRSWERLARFLGDPAKLAAEYEDDWDGEAQQLSGHWIAFHLLEHDIHHRADIFHYLALLGIEHPDVGTP